MQAAPTFRSVDITLSSLISQPHSAQTFEAFSNDPVPQAVVTIFRSSNGETGWRSPQQQRVLNGISNFFAVWHRPEKSWSSTGPYGVSIRRVTVLPPGCGFPSLPRRGNASASVV